MTQSRDEISEGITRVRALRQDFSKNMKQFMKIYDREVEESENLRDQLARKQDTIDSYATQIQELRAAREQAKKIMTALPPGSIQERSLAEDFRSLTAELADKKLVLRKLVDDYERFVQRELSGVRQKILDINVRRERAKLDPISERDDDDDEDEVPTETVSQVGGERGGKAIKLESSGRFGVATHGYQYGPKEGAPIGESITMRTLYKRMQQRWKRELMKQRVPSTGAMPTVFHPWTQGWIPWVHGRNGAVIVPGGTAAIDKNLEALFNDQQFQALPLSLENVQQTEEHMQGPRDEPFVAMANVLRHRSI